MDLHGAVPPPVNNALEFDAEDDEHILRVKSSSNPQSLASAISYAVYDSKPVKLRCIGASATNQAVKAVAIARGFVAPRGIDLTIRPGFVNLESRDGVISAIVLSVVVSR